MVAGLVGCVGLGGDDALEDARRDEVEGYRLPVGLGRRERRAVERRRAVALAEPAHVHVFAVHDRHARDALQRGGRIPVGRTRDLGRPDRVHDGRRPDPVGQERDVAPRLACRHDGDRLDGDRLGLERDIEGDQAVRHDDAGDSLRRVADALDDDGVRAGRQAGEHEPAVGVGERGEAQAGDGNACADERLRVVTGDPSGEPSAGRPCAGGRLCGGGDGEDECDEDGEEAGGEVRLSRARPGVRSGARPDARNIRA